MAQLCTRGLRCQLAVTLRQAILFMGLHPHACTLGDGETGCRKPCELWSSVGIEVLRGS